MSLLNVHGEVSLVKVGQLQFSQNGEARINITVAADNSKWDRQSQSRIEATKEGFYSITFFRQDAEAFAEADLKPGAKFVVSGQVHVRKYQKDDGTTGQSVVIEAYSWGLKPKAQSAGGNGGQQNQQNKAVDPWSGAPQGGQQAPQQNQQQQFNPNQQQQMPPQQMQQQGYPQQNQQAPQQGFQPQQNQIQGGWNQPGNGEPPF